MKGMQRMAAGVLAACCLPLSGCGSPKVSDQMEGVKAQPLTLAQTTQEEWNHVADFGVRLLQETMAEGESTLISPLSVLCALAMTANGAKGETLAQMEQVLGAPVDRLNQAVHALMGEESETLHLANSVWFTQQESFTVNQDFLQTNANYYGAGVYEAPFDASTVKAINRWVKEETHGMIGEILDEIPPDTVMYLVNALAFEAEWDQVYTKSDVQSGTFTTHTGDTQSVELMYSHEGIFLQDEQTKGFVKPYAGGKYAFVALLPEEGVSVEAYVDSLTGERLREILQQGQETTVKAAIPKFECGSDVQLTQALENMGMTLAFHGDQADLSGIGTYAGGNLFVNRVLHKTYISVAEQGTRAGAATVVEVNGEGAMDPGQMQEVILNRPFVYLLVDLEHQMPLFLGTVMAVKSGA
ncbi:serpin family protein [Pseudoflavonifractor sp. An85]|uniref:serpin family protein n=1 Tax=Pseudoflavonifractor sp. An85 TaxID=1965661 RepID=UPI000B3A4EFD|nr:serpin family protein [Pseudoflavonifractor sp. An85]OUN25697.1 hypothetical protein B5G37_02485 [Pseudoflavonifractor sp. An85]